MDMSAVYLTSPMSDINGKINNLLSLNLKHLEATIYLYLAENTPSSALFLSRTLAIPRTSIYDTLTRLIEKGLVERVVRDKSTSYKASALSQFDSFITSEQEKIATMTNSLKALQSQLKTRVGELKNTEVRYYQGAEGMRQMVWNCLRAKGEIVGYSVFGRVDVIGIKFQQRFVQEFSTRKLSDRVIANPTKRTLDFIFKDVKPGFHQMSFQNIRTIPEKQLYISGDTMIYNNTYAVSYWQGHEVVGVEIENPDFVKHELSIFELLWKIANPITSSSKKV